jgi:hypothetical protein
LCPERSLRYLWNWGFVCAHSPWPLWVRDEARGCGLRAFLGANSRTFFVFSPLHPISHW